MSIVELCSNKSVLVQIAARLKLSRNLEAVVLELWKRSQIDEIGPFLEESSLRASLKLSNRELRAILISWNQTLHPKITRGQLLALLWKNSLDPHRKSYCLKDLLELSDCDWKSLELLWENLWSEIPCEEQLRQFLIGFQINPEHFQDTKLINLCWDLYQQGTIEDISEVSRRAPNRNLLELSGHLAHGELLERSPAVLMTQLRHLHLDVDSLSLSQVQLLALYTMTEQNMVERDVAVDSSFRTLHFALLEALRGVVTPINLVELPDSEDRASVEMELGMLAGFHQPINLSQYLSLREINDEELREALQILRIPMMEAMNRFQMLFLICHRSLPPPWNTEEIADRFDQVANLDHREREALFELYQTADLAVILQNQQIKIEKLLYGFFDQHQSGNWVGIEDRCKKFGIVPPAHFNQEDRYAYIILALAGYTPVFERDDSDQHLESFTDQELVDSFGVIPWYQSRRELLDAYNSERPQLFRVMDPSKSRNPEESIVDLDDPPEDPSTEFIYGWGTPEHFYWLSPSEMLVLLEKSTLSIMSPFKDLPGNIHLAELGRMAIMANDQPVKDLVHAKILLTGDIQMIMEQNLEGMKLWLAKIFEAAMYMRRWNGPGHPYPLERTATRVQNNYLVNLSHSLLELEQIAKDHSLVPILKKIKTIGTYGFRMNVWELFRSVRNDQFCIRVASRLFIDIALKYTEKLGNTILNPATNQPLTLDEVYDIY